MSDTTRGAYAADEQTRNAWDAGYAANKHEVDTLRAALAAAEGSAKEQYDLLADMYDKVTNRAAAAEQRAEKAEALLRQWQEAHAAAAHMDERWHGSFDVLMATEEHFIMPLPPPVVDLRGGEKAS